MFCTPVWSYILELQTEKMILKKQHKPKCNVRYYVKVQTLKVCEVLELFSTLTIKTMEFNSSIVLFPEFKRLKWSKHNRMQKRSNKFYSDLTFMNVRGTTDKGFRKKSYFIGFCYTNMHT